MAEPEAPPAPQPKKSRRPLLIGLLLAVLLGAGGFYATWSGLLFGPGGTVAHAETEEAEIAFVPVEPLVISLGQGGAARHLRFTSQIEVGAAEVEEITHLLPRIVDVLNGYLRALDTKVLEDPTALVRMRAHLLRRIQIVTGEGRVRDLLITEFVLN